MTWCQVLTLFEWIEFRCCRLTYVFFSTQGALVANYPWDGTQDKRWETIFFKSFKHFIMHLCEIGGKSLTEIFSGEKDITLVKILLSNKFSKEDFLPISLSLHFKFYSLEFTHTYTVYAQYTCAKNAYG